MDLKTPSDDELSDHLNNVIAEQERRASLTRIPGQITDLRTKYAECGGNPSALP